MTGKKLPFTKEKILEVMKKFPTPFHIYDEKALKENAKKFKEAFGKLEGFKEYFAVKALPNPYILSILRQEGFGADCSSMPELLLAEKAGITRENIMFTSNDTPSAEYAEAKK